MSGVARKPAPRHAKPAQRHFARKAPTGIPDEDDSSEEEQQQQEIVEETHDEEIGAYGDEADVQTFVTQGKAPERGAKALKVALGNVQVQDGRVIIDGQTESGKTLVEQRSSNPYHGYDQLLT
jgi:microfibrillar-associated protein 1